jgi:hypothetical protein
MADTGNTNANNGDEDNDYIIEINNNENLQSIKSVAQDTKEYTLYNEFKVIADDMKNWFQIPHNLRLYIN